MPPGPTLPVPVEEEEEEEEEEDADTDAAGPVASPPLPDPPPPPPLLCRLRLVCMMRSLEARLGNTGVARGLAAFLSSACGNTRFTRTATAPRSLDTTSPTAHTPPMRRTSTRCPRTNGRVCVPAGAMAARADRAAEHRRGTTRMDPPGPVGAAAASYQKA